MTKSFKKVSALLLGLTMLGGVFGGALLARDPGGVVNAAAGDMYEKVTKQLDDYSGTYLVAWESSSTEAWVFNASLANPDVTNNYVKATLNNGTIIAAEDTSSNEVEISKDSGGTNYQMKSVATGNYFYGGSSNDLKYGASEPSSQLTITYDTDLSRTSIVSSAGAAKYFVFNNMSGQDRFRFMKNDCSGASSGNTSYRPVQLYKKVEVVVTDPIVTIAGETSGAVGDVVTLTATTMNFTETELTYSWTVATGGEELVKLTNADTAEVTVEFIKSGEVTINLAVSGTTESAENSVTITIQDILTVTAAKDLADNQKVYVRGIVYAQYGNSFYIADEDGTGMQLYTYSDLGIAVGEEVVVTGTLGTYNEGRQLNNPVIISHEATEKVVTPKVLTHAELDNKYVNDFIAVENMVWHSGAASELNIYFHEEGDSAKELVLYNHDKNSAAYAGALTTAMANWEADVTTVTLAGVYGVYETTLEIFLTSVTTYEIDAVDTFARKFLATELCDNGVTEPDTALWAELKTKFEALNEEEKAVLRGATGNEQGNVVEQAMARYDYIIEKYGAERYDNFIAREITPASNVVDNFFGSNDNLTIILVVAITLVSLSILIGFRFYLNKRKSNK